MRNVDFDRAIADVARRQHGTFDTPQARSVGGSADVLRNRATVGSIIHLAPKVWAVAGHPPTWRRQYKAAELSVPGSALADRAAGLVHGFDSFRVVRPTVVVNGEASRRQRLTSVRRSTDFCPTMVDGLRVTSQAQTLFDLLDCCQVSVVERCMDGALISGGVTVADLLERQEAMERLGRRHITVWRALVEERSSASFGRAESELEAVLHRLLRRLPAEVEVEYQATPPWWGEASGRVDAYIPQWRLVIEVDGRRWHTRVADFERDRWRDNLAAAHGQSVMRFTFTHLARRSDEALGLILDAGATRASRVVAPPA